MNKVETITKEVITELHRAISLHPTFHSPHHGYAIILEELDEAWDEIKKNNTRRTREEMIQVAAMAIRFIHDMED